MTEVLDPGLRADVTAAWSFELGDDDAVFELWIVSVTHGSRPDADAWPPVYRTWTAATRA